MTLSAQAGAGRRFCLLVSRFNEVVTEQLEAGAIKTLQRHGVEAGDIDVVAVPGAWELAYAARLAGQRGYDGILALGCVIRGETPHFEYVCFGAASGLEAAGRSCDVPITFGVLTTDTLEQALQRVGGSGGHKGEEAALAALEMSQLRERWLGGD
ncbi:MAG: 6,7-dimethyl-8-ribityllumazine synthase [Gemmatimonadota bacterium]